MNTQPRSLASGSAMMLLSLTSAGVVSVLISIMIARTLGVDDFGIYSILISLQGVVSMIAGFGLGTAVAKYIAEYRVRDEERALRFAKTGLGLTSIFALAAGIVYVLISGLIGNELYKEPSMVGLIPFSALVVLSSTILSMAVAIAQGCQKIRMLAEIQISSPVLSLTLISILLSYIGIRGIFIGYFLSQLTISSLSLLRLNRNDFRFGKVLLEPGIRSTTASRLLSFGFPMLLGGLMVVPVVWIASTDLAISSGFQAMGYFAVALTIYQSLAVVPNSIAIPLLPRISELSAVSEKDVERVVSNAVSTLSVVLFPLLFAIGLASPFIVNLLYGQSYASSVEVMYLMVAASYFYALAALLGTMISGMGRVWLGFGLNAFWAGMFLALVFILVPVQGANGLGIAYAASYGSFLVSLVVVSKRLLHVDIRSVYVTGLSSVAFFTIGFFLFDREGLAVYLERAGLLAVAVAFFMLIGWKDVVATVHRFKQLLLELRNSQ